MKKNDKREQILSAASKCIAKNGYANVSLRDIADEAGVVLSQLNYYFGNKEVIFSEIIKNFVDSFLEGFKNYLNLGKMVENKIELLSNYLKKVSQEDKLSFKLLCDLVSMSLWSDSFKKIFNDLFARFNTLIEEHLFSKKSLNENYNKYPKATLANVVANVMFGIMMKTSVSTADGNSNINSLDVMNEIFK
ncbi:TetR/AcrR family transcriptional regulator [Clostridium sp. 'deep sea']|uniref:TetR/AcrR family transcriptional regulator n=1 Tax=Clostridium sp. 'deep sea' TaxID=2779445 RepID=UPI0018966F85|nr:TetR/AcrR family transcriptional regulator [Clostridium sp. 'deep sea']QOR35288.1 TetR/AcrR family transcriptional regulator [Clostridium sp. 'deep sea']